MNIVNYSNRMNPGYLRGKGVIMLPFRKIDYKQGIVVPAFSSGIQGEEAGRLLWVWGQHDLHSEFRVTQGYTMWLHLKEKGKERNKIMGIT